MILPTTPIDIKVLEAENVKETNLQVGWILGLRAYITAVSANIISESPLVSYRVSDASYPCIDVAILGIRMRLIIGLFRLTCRHHSS